MLEAFPEDEELESLLAKLRQKDIITERIGFVRSELKRQQSLSLSLADQLKDKQYKLEKLEGSSIRSLFLKILGNAKQQLDKRRQEELILALKYNSILDERKSFEYELDILEKKLKEFEESSKRVSELLLHKEMWLKQQDTIAGKKIIDFDQRIAEIQTKLVDCDEAISNAENAHALLHKLKSELQKIVVWRATIVEYGTTVTKSELKRRQRRIQKKAVECKHALMLFEKELLDVYSKLELNFNLQTFDNFLDIFYDNLITDWIIQKKISSSKAGVSNCMDKVYRFRMMIENDLPKLTKQLESLKEEKKLYLLHL